jgi:hypothetical protein
MTPKDGGVHCRLPCRPNLEGLCEGVGEGRDAVERHCNTVGAGG